MFARRNVAQDLVAVQKNQAALALALAALQAPGTVEKWPDPTVSRLCVQRDFNTEEFASWCRAFGEKPRYHRKLWEWVFIAEALGRSGLLQAGKRGVGFAVGKEPLPAAFASLGCELVASDLDVEDPLAKDWVATGQHARGLDSLLDERICDPELLKRNVTWRSIDMRAIPADLTGFDFCWSSCAMEHLGSLDAGMKFLERSLQCLRPGGMAVHTTEYSIFGAEPHPDGPTVLYRPVDIEAALNRLEERGHRIAPLDRYVGEGVLDWFGFVTPALVQEPMLRLFDEEHFFTSAGIIVWRAG